MPDLNTVAGMLCLFTAMNITLRLFSALKIRRWRYSVRDILVATTLIAIALYLLTIMPGK
jgi:hypothetical protein